MAVRQAFRVILWNPREFGRPIAEEKIETAIKAAVKDWVDVEVQSTGVDRYVLKAEKIDDE